MNETTWRQYIEEFNELYESAFNEEDSQKLLPVGQQLTQHLESIIDHHLSQNNIGLADEALKFAQRSKLQDYTDLKARNSQLGTKIDEKRNYLTTRKSSIAMSPSSEPVSGGNQEQSVEPTPTTPELIPSDGGDQLETDLSPVSVPQLPLPSGSEQPNNLEEHPTITPETKPGLEPPDPLSTKGLWESIKSQITYNLLILVMLVTIIVIVVIILATLFSTNTPEPPIPATMTPTSTTVPLVAVLSPTPSSTPSPTHIPTLPTPTPTLTATPTVTPLPTIQITIVSTPEQPLIFVYAMVKQETPIASFTINPPEAVDEKRVTLNLSIDQETISADTWFELICNESNCEVWPKENELIPEAYTGRLVLTVSDQDSEYHLLTVDLLPFYPFAVTLTNQVGLRAIENRKCTESSTDLGNSNEFEVEVYGIIRTYTQGGPVPGVLVKITPPEKDESEIRCLPQTAFGVKADTTLEGILMKEINGLILLPDFDTFDTAPILSSEN